MGRLVVVLLLLLMLLLLLDWRQGGAGEAMPPLRIVCTSGDGYVRCPSDCRVHADGSSSCRCQDFYYRRGDRPLTFSHSLCR